MTTECVCVYVIGAHVSSLYEVDLLASKLMREKNYYDNIRSKWFKVNYELLIFSLTTLVCVAQIV